MAGELTLLFALLLCAPLCLTVRTGLHSATLCCGTDCADLANDSPRAWELRNALRR